MPTVTAVRQRIPDKFRVPEPDAADPIRAAIREWSGPDVPTLGRLKEMAEEVKDLEAELDALRTGHVEAVADGDTYDISRMRDIKAEIEARQEAVPLLQRRMMAEQCEVLEQELRDIEAEREELRDQIPTLSDRFGEAKAKADAALRALRGAQTQLRFRTTEKHETQREIRQIEKRLARLAQES